MADEILQMGDLVEILPAAEPAPGQPAPPKQYGRIVELEDAEGRVTVEIQRRHYPVRLRPEQIRRVDLEDLDARSRRRAPDRNQAGQDSTLREGGERGPFLRS